jgi:hypothetical protein
MSISQYELHTLCVYALRYTMGRATYAAGDVAKIISDHWPALSEDQRRQLASEARRHIGSPGLDETNRFAYERIASLPVEVTE